LAPGKRFVAGGVPRLRELHDFAALRGAFRAVQDLDSAPHRLRRHRQRRLPRARPRCFRSRSASGPAGSGAAFRFCLFDRGVVFRRLVGGVDVCPRSSPSPAGSIRTSRTLRGRPWARKRGLLIVVIPEDRRRRYTRPRTSPRAAPRSPRQ
jgi:hypothetical protein